MKKRKIFLFLQILILLLTLQLPVFASSETTIKKADNYGLNEIKIYFSDYYRTGSIAKTDFRINGKKLDHDQYLDMDYHNKVLSIKNKSNFVSAYGQSVTLKVSGIKDINGKFIKTFEKKITFQKESNVKIKKIKTSGKSTIVIYFSDSFQKIVKSNFRINGKKLISADRLYVDYDKNKVTLKRKDGFVLKYGKSVKLSISGVKDLSGKKITGVNKKVTFHKTLS